MATIYEVSELAGVSLATVSRVINDSGVVSPKTRDKVIEAMRELGYRPNTIAQSLATKRSNSVGVLIPELYGPFFGVILSSIEDELRTESKHVIITAGHSDEAIEKDGIEFLSSRNCDALILHVYAVSDEYIEQLRESNIPIVVIGRSVPGMESNCISIDNEQGGYAATKTLIELGHRQIATITGPLWKNDGKRRFEGYRRALDEFGLEFNPALQAEGDYEEASGRRGMRQLLEQEIPFTALVCANDEMAAGAVAVAQQRGISHRRYGSHGGPLRAQGCLWHERQGDTKPFRAQSGAACIDQGTLIMRITPNILLRLAGLLGILVSIEIHAAGQSAGMDRIDRRVDELISRMTVAEKIGQMTQVNASETPIPDELYEAVKAGRIGSILNQVDVDLVNEIQRLAVEESRLGIPLMVGRDVIHGFQTVQPIPLGQAATWNPELVQKGARAAALEAASTGVNWTFAPMIDISRDPRWGRIAESFGEDPYMTGVFGAAMVRGFQGDDFSQPGNIAACAKHFAGYGASESGRDYNTTNIPENELRNVYLPPFKAAIDAGVATLMTSFSDLDGVPASGNRFLLKQVLRDEWQFDGFVVSDWASIEQLSVHGFTANDKEAAYEAASAGLNMEMATPTYANIARKP
jgi:DNA-binding LacI/PurR family transcriptional regulator